MIDIKTIRIIEPVSTIIVDARGLLCIPTRGEPYEIIGVYQFNDDHKRTEYERLMLC